MNIDFRGREGVRALDGLPTEWTATQLLHAYRQRLLSPVEAVAASIARVAELDPVLNAVTTAMFEQASERARRAEQRWSRRAPRALEGVPVLVKDLIDTGGVRTTYGSAMFARHVPEVDAAVVERARRSGAIVLAKTATHEFGWGITTASERYGPTRNPWSTDRSPGGSSGGSAAGLAAGYAPLALGTDTAGSIRIPASFCGVTGLKPSFGAVPTTGVRTLVPSLDHVGPMARSVEDLVLLWSTISGRATPPAVTRAEDVVVGMLTERTGPPLAAAVHEGCTAVAASLSGLGHRVVDVDGRRLAPAFGALSTIVLDEGIATHRRAGLWPDRAGEYGADVRARLERAERLTPQDVAAARAARVAVRAATEAIFSDVDVLLSPVSTTGPCRVDSVPEDYRERVLTDIAPQSLAGLPSLTVRAGFDEDGLPVGVQLSGPVGSEALLLEMGVRLERATPATRAGWPGR